MKKVLMMAAVALAAVTLKAEADSWMLWCVDSSDAALNAATWTSAKLYAKNTTGTVVEVDPNGTPGGWVAKSAATDSVGGVKTGLWGGSSSVAGNEWSYFVEILNDSDPILQSAVVNYAALAQYITTQGMDAPAGGPYAFSGFAAIPEPTSGLLLMLGLCGLALKRKRV